MRAQSHLVYTVVMATIITIHNPYERNGIGTNENNSNIFITIDAVWVSFNSKRWNCRLQSHPSVCRFPWCFCAPEQSIASAVGFNRRFQPLVSTIGFNWLRFNRNFTFNRENSLLSSLNNHLIAFVFVLTSCSSGRFHVWRLRVVRDHCWRDDMPQTVKLFGVRARFFALFPLFVAQRRRHTNSKRFILKKVTNSFFHAFRSVWLRFRPHNSFSFLSLRSHNARIMWPNCKWKQLFTLLDMNKMLLAFAVVLLCLLQWKLHFLNNNACDLAAFAFSFE